VGWRQLRPLEEREPEMNVWAIFVEPTG